MNTEETTILKDQEDTTVVRKPEVEGPATETQRSGCKHAGKWKKVVIGGVSGILLGSASAYAAAAVSDMSEDGDNADGSQDDVAEEQVEVEDVSLINDDMSFGEAFAAARAELGPGEVFQWRGNMYNTYTAEEWDAQQNTESEEVESVEVEVIASVEDEGQELEVEIENESETDVLVVEDGLVTDMPDEMLAIEDNGYSGGGMPDDMMDDPFNNYDVEQLV